MSLASFVLQNPPFVPEHPPMAKLWIDQARLQSVKKLEGLLLDEDDEAVDMLAGGDIASLQVVERDARRDVLHSLIRTAIAALIGTSALAAALGWFEWTSMLTGVVLAGILLAALALVAYFLITSFSRIRGAEQALLRVDQGYCEAASDLLVVGRKHVFRVSRQQNQVLLLEDLVTAEVTGGPSSAIVVFRDMKGLPVLNVQCRRKDGERFVLSFYAAKADLVAPHPDTVPVEPQT